MPRTLPQPDPSAFDRSPRSAVDPRHAWMLSISIRNIRFRWRFIHAWRGSTVSTKVDTTNSHLNLSEVGRWAGRTVGAMDGAIEPGMGLRRVLPAHTPPPRKPAVAVASAVAIDSAGAGLQALLDQPLTVMVWVSDSHVGGTGHAAAWLPSSTLRRSRGSICGASTCTSSARNHAAPGRAATPPRRCTRRSGPGPATNAGLHRWN